MPGLGARELACHTTHSRSGRPGCAEVTKHWTGAKVAANMGATWYAFGPLAWLLMVGSPHHHSPAEVIQHSPKGMQRLRLKHSLGR